MTVLWVFVRIQSPFLLACSYGLIKRFDKLASPFIVIPAISLICGLYYFKDFAGADFAPFYFHIPVAGAIIIGTYLLLRKFGYSNPQSFILAALMMIALDELWQTPWNVQLWTRSLQYFQYGIATAGWNLMSLPLLGYFVLKFNGRLKLGDFGQFMFIISLGLTGLATLLLKDPLAPMSPFDYEYLLILPWTLFFLAIFRSSFIKAK